MFIARILLFGLTCGLISSGILAADLPQQCVQLPQRTDVCPNMMYKRASVPVKATNTEVGEMVCICMADFESLRIRALTEPEKSQQAAKIRRNAASLGLSEVDLIALIRN